MIALFVVFALLIFGQADVSALPPRASVCHAPTSTTVKPPTPPPGEINCELAVNGLDLIQLSTGIYHINHTRINWFDAYNACKAHNMQLAQLYTSETLELFYDETLGIGGHHWIGATDIGYEVGDMRWENGEPVDLNLIFIGPSIFPPNCMMLCINKYFLHALTCDSLRDGYICEIPPNCLSP
ncbi:uncharacterized protein LOC135943578 [Cloeon dipterum]|uniref:uncharacterized protein LOC135943578 n=1 Tax=Cloeon dipterum TaxID=197152 RepID=UPI0032205198